MRKVIWKYRVPLEDSFSIEMPEGAKTLCVQVQRSEPHIWVEIPTDTKGYIRKIFYLIGTGHRLDMTNLRYIGTFQLPYGNLVFHLYEVGLDT